MTLVSWELPRRGSRRACRLCVPECIARQAERTTDATSLPPIPSLPAFALPLPSPTRPQDQAGAIKNTEIAQELCLPPVKLHCSMLAEDAIKAAISDYKKKRVASKARGGSGKGTIEVDVSEKSGVEGVRVNV